MKETLSRDGAKEGYEKIKDFYIKPYLGSGISSHILVHIAGEELYHHSGFDAVAVCDDQFDYGCYHGLFKAAFADQGESVVGKLNTACFDAFGDHYYGCQHGIGHGLAEHFGQERLVDSLRNCQEIQPQITPFGCIGGVLMEYNFPLIYEKGRPELVQRTFNSDNPYTPCPDLPRDLQAACYFRQVEWWSAVFENDYLQVAKLCEGLGDSLFADDCFYALGATMPITDDFDINRAKSVCDSLDRRDRDFCYHGASWVAYAYQEEELASTFCLPGCRNYYLKDEEGKAISFW